MPISKLLGSALVGALIAGMFFGAKALLSRDRAPVPPNRLGLVGLWQSGPSCFRLSSSGEVSFVLQSDGGLHALRGGVVYGFPPGAIEVGLPNAIWPDSLKISDAPYESDSRLALRVQGIELFRDTSGRSCDF
ncbi:MAG: hypothetical protein R2724_34230 [Bryobacterales bacterium]